MKTKKNDTTTILNRKAKFNFELIEFFEAGMVLTGSEVKSIRDGKANLMDAYVVIKGCEDWLHNAHITPYSPSAQFSHEPTRKRKLLLHRQEILKLSGKLNEKGLTLVPIKIYFSKSGHAKIEIALGRGKKLHDKRQDIKARDAKREVERALQRKG